MPHKETIDWSTRSGWEGGLTCRAGPVDGGALSCEVLALGLCHAGSGAVVVGARRARVLLEGQDVEDAEQPCRMMKLRHGFRMQDVAEYLHSVFFKRDKVIFK